MQAFGRKYSLSSSVSHSSGQTNTARASSNLCNRCKNFEEELLNTSDNLSAINTELKASRQCISLLQREIQLLRQQKLDLEKLVISQSSDVSDTTTNDLIDSDWNIVLPNSTSTGDVDLATIEKTTQSDKEDKLLKLIKTQVYEKAQDILNINLKLKKAEDDKEQLNNQLLCLQEENTKLKNDNAVYTEMLELRDQTVVSLTNELFETEALANGSNNRRRRSEFIPTIPSAIASKSSTLQYGRGQSKLVGTINAYKKQNEILSSNVIRLTDKCQQSERREIELRSQCHELEAKCCQIQSKLLSLLKEIDQSTKQRKEEMDKSNDNGLKNSEDMRDNDVVCSESVKFLIKRLLEDKSLDIPLSWREGNQSTNKQLTNKNGLINKCDDLGFYYCKEENSELRIASSARSDSHSNADCPLDSIDENTEVEDNDRVEDKTLDGTRLRNKERYDNPRPVIRSMPLDPNRNDAKVKWRNKWDNFIKSIDTADLTKSREFKSLLRSGCPHEYRCKVWKSLIQIKVGQLRNSNYGPDYYQCLLNPHPAKKLNPSGKQIELDLLRTLPNNRHFESLDSNGTIRLRKVLTAYSLHNPSIGYCQGMNRLAALALLVLPEEEAFWCLVTIIEYIMPPGYYSNLWLAQIDSSVVGEYIGIKMPLLNDHLMRHGIEVSLFAWFLTIFVDGMPSEIFLRCWDCFLYEGDKGELKVHQHASMLIPLDLTTNNNVLLYLNLELQFYSELL